MQAMQFSHAVPRALGGDKAWTLVGVVASGNLEVMAERNTDTLRCEVRVSTAVPGFDAVWKDVISDVVERLSPGGITLSINDGGARPDMVALRLTQAVRAMEGPSHG